MGSRWGFLARRLFAPSWLLYSFLAQASIHPAVAAEGKTLVLIGASYVESWGTPELSPYVVINKGVSGQTTDQILARFSDDAVAGKPSTVLIWGHINNVHRGDRQAMDQVRLRAAADYRAMVAAARAAGIEVVLATEITLSEAVGWRDRLAASIGRVLGKRGYAAWVNDHVRSINEWLRDFAKSEGVRLLDFERVFDDGDGFRKLEYTSPDGTHISAEGYSALSEYSRSQLHDL